MKSLRSDVPAVIALGLLGVLAAVFFSLVQVTPTWPTSFAHLTYDEEAVLRLHRAASTRTPPPGLALVERAWDAWTRAVAADDDAAAQGARERFRERLLDASSAGNDASTTLRAVLTERFLARVDDVRDPLVTIARRHGLAGADAPPYATRAARIAWFALRWERLIAPVGDDGHVEPFTDTLLRVPAPYRRAFVSWALDARCYELVGVRVGLRATANELRSCAALRAELVPIARGLDRTYPADEMLAVVDAMLGASLHALSAPSPDAPVTVVDDAAQRVTAGAAQDALLRARERFATLNARRPMRRYQRYVSAIHSALATTIQ